MSTTRGAEIVWRGLLAISIVGCSWLGMQAVHESGHALAAWAATGGRVMRVVLLPHYISRTDFEQNPRPLAVAWAGPVFGAITPLGLWGAACLLTRRYVYLARFFAGFCLVANGAYLAGGLMYRAGDAGDLLRHGASGWQLAAFGLIAVVARFVLWNGLGPKFGWGTNGEAVDRRAATIIGCALLEIAGGEWLVAALVGLR